MADVVGVGHRCEFDAQSPLVREPAPSPVPNRDLVEVVRPLLRQGLRSRNQR